MGDDHYLRQELYDLVRRNDAIFDFLQSGSLDGLWYWDLERPEHEWMSPRFWEVLGYDPAQKRHLASEWQDLIDPDDLALASENFRRHCADPDYPYDQTVRYRHRDGSTVWVRCRGIVIRDAAGRPLRMLGAHTDVTALQAEIAERRQLEAANREYAERAMALAVEAERISRSKSEFLSSMSHELRTPLNAIIGFTGTLLMRLPGPLTEAQEKQLKTIQSSARHLLTLVNDILDLTRIEAGKVSIELAPVDCREVLEDVAAGLRHMAAEKGLAFSLEAPAGPLLARSDRRALSQILINLVTNAIKFTDQGGVTLRLLQQDACGRMQDADDRPGAHPASCILFEICDTGIGISEADLARVFQVFERGGSPEVRHREGTGLGLRLSKMLAGLLGGAIDVRSALGQGSTFTLTLPVA